MNFDAAITLTKNLEYSNDISLPIIIGILISGFWLASRLEIFSNFQKNIDDKQGILLPSLSFIASPFISVYIFDLYQNNTFVEILKSATPLVAILTFFLGQYTAKREKRLDKEKQNKNIAKKVLSSLGQLILIGGSLSSIEAKLKNAKPKNFEFEKFQEFCKPKLFGIKKEVQQNKENDLVYSIPYGSSIIAYLQRVEEYVKEIINGEYQETSFNSYSTTDSLEDLRHFILDGYEYALMLMRDFIEQDPDFQTYIKQLKTRRKNLSSFKKFKENTKSMYLKFRHDGDSRYQKIEKEYYFLEENIDRETTLLKKIDELVEKFEIQ